MSSSSTETVAGFRLRRRLGEELWEADQPELGRRVALRRLPPGARFSPAAWPDRRGVVELYAVVEDPSGTYVATRFVPGARTLAELRGSSARRRARWVDEAAAILDGTVHGRLSEDDVLVDGDDLVHVTGFGRARDGATAADDRAVLDALRPRARRRGLLLAPLGVAAVVAAAVGLLLLRGGDGVPAVTAGATAMGSALAAGAVQTRDCEGHPASGSSVPCTVMQTALPGRSLVARADGLVRGWAVRGATGPVALQVVVRDGDGWIAYNRSETVTADAADRAQVFPADMSVPAGARFALEVEPGGALGVRPRAGAATTRFFGPLRADRRSADTSGGGGQELLLRVDLVPRG